MEQFDEKDLETLAYALPEDVLQRKMAGDYEGAQALIDRWLERAPGSLLERRLRLEKEILRRLPEDYPDSLETCLSKVQKVLPDVTPEGFRQLQKDGRIDWIYVKGEERFFDRVTEVLLDDPKRKHHSDVLLGKVKDENTWPPLSATTQRVRDSVKRMQESGEAESWRFRIRTTFRLQDEAFRPGRLRVWLPLPRASEQIHDIRILSVSGQDHRLAPEDAAQRTILFERNLKENEEFHVEYEWVTTARYVDLWDPAARRKGTQDAVYPDHSPAPCAADLAEALPHIQFTPYMRALAEEIAGRIEDPLEKARAFYNYITTKVKYSYVRSYFTIEELSEYAAIGHKGDCGIQALMFLTLCRIAGIPARWQSALTVDGAQGSCHDWAQFWTSEYGWLFCDPSYGGGAHDAGDEKRRQFYFGNLDPFRMVANNTFQAQFSARSAQEQRQAEEAGEGAEAFAPRYLRNDPYDNQVGEAEWADGKIPESGILTSREVTLRERI